ncbi:MAG TPA: penicillin acylase family protein, partial [Chitinophagaceae bacterium]|nr:penicillin acylase family protein [Chitinophagaceae bacterium]
YKLLDYKPELWSKLKVALFLKMMSKDLAGYERDLEFTNARSVFGAEELNFIFPEFSDSSVPIIPKGTGFITPGVVPVAPANRDSLYFRNDTAIKDGERNKPDPSNGSNSWAVNGTKTKSGAPILSNDPHLNLSLPSIWFEMQISTPGMNVYGATFPGAPTVIIGFNDDVAFGFTNAMRDVKDYYQVQFKDRTKRQYWYNGAWKEATGRVEIIKVRGAPDYLDTVAYTHFGPVMYDHSFGADSATNSAIAVRWIAHEPSNEILNWLKLNKAKSYDDCEAAIKTFVCPGQNMLFASKDGQIGLWQQGKFPARWQGQGLYVMPGQDSSYEWQGFIPQEENPHVINPSEGFIQSANQHPVDSSYPYFAPGNYITPRGVRINERLKMMQGITPEDMMGLQNDYYNTSAEDFVPYLLKHTITSALNEAELKYLDEIKGWNYYAIPNSRAATIYQAWLDSLKGIIWNDDFERVAANNLAPNNLRPDEQTLIEALLKDSVFRYTDNIRTTEKESINDQVTAALKEATAGLLVEEKENGLVWWKHKNPSVYHLLRTSVLPFASTGLEVGGWSNTVNAIKSTHGPSWRMIVHLTTPTEAYGIYPGGQSGNPGSRFYQNFIGDWSKGKYYPLWMMKMSETTGKRVKWKMTFTNA